ncbi:hypothetical protein ACH95_07620 [Bacillus glycinifermentans]|uniref:YppG family protein n=1 Tax=Bacillus glycinifermentans TaxID=1664069 RepID=A0A0J6E2E7_9BACI|nr:YppG family protein [Bacillus glycinifermentans]ATH92129.1 hypothetical protein COP00_05435 [Bacillus glycinifermentans]KMM61429.1 hypothetical protein ACH95_07620 [Bacillus glycinifermentans]KRT94875.1 hypothetical protein AB447_210050 [Bacillus glycinifermentans]MEC0484633.1 YppG family protein [Bacillus glycinifermentans]MEC0494706.1 YppG family protein [Bacillus glycinifermentans]
MEERSAAGYPFSNQHPYYPAYPHSHMNPPYQPVPSYYSQEPAQYTQPAGHGYQPSPAYHQPVGQHIDPFPAYQQPVHYHMQQVHAFPYPNPYPLPRPNLHQPSQFQSFMSQFKKKNGQFDFSKMMDTAGQMVSTVNQVGALAKGFIGFFK